MVRGTDRAHACAWCAPAGNMPRPYLTVTCGTDRAHACAWCAPAGNMGVWEQVSSVTTAAGTYSLDPTP
eukprot:1140134-Rhodomonas_salina.5